jgi:hypothetical protein
LSHQKRAELAWERAQVQDPQLQRAQLALVAPSSRQLNVQAESPRGVQFALAVQTLNARVAV